MKGERGTKKKEDFFVHYFVDNFGVLIFVNVIFKFGDYYGVWVMLFERRKQNDKKKVKKLNEKICEFEKMN